MTLGRQRGLRKPLNHALHAVAVQRLQRTPAQTRLAQQVLDGFIQILFRRKTRVVRRNCPHETRESGFFRRLRLFDPVLKGSRSFSRLLMMCGGVTDNQYIGLELLTIMFQQPQAFGLRHQRSSVVRQRRNINNIYIINDASLYRQHQLTG